MALVSFDRFTGMFQRYEIGRSDPVLRSAAEAPVVTVPLPALKEFTGVRIFPIGRKAYLLTDSNQFYRQRTHPYKDYPIYIIRDRAVSKLPKQWSVYDQHLTHPSVFLIGQYKPNNKTVRTASGPRGAKGTVLRLVRIDPISSHLETIWTTVIDDAYQANLPEAWPIQPGDIALRKVADASGSVQLDDVTPKVHAPFTAQDRIKYGDNYHWFVVPCSSTTLRTCAPARYIVHNTYQIFDSYIVYTIDSRGAATRLDHAFEPTVSVGRQWLSHPFVAFGHHYDYKPQSSYDYVRDLRTGAQQRLPSELKIKNMPNSTVILQLLLYDTVDQWVEMNGTKEDLVEVMGADLAGYTLSFYRPSFGA